MNLIILPTPKPPSKNLNRFEMFYDYQFCIECDRVTIFDDWICTCCGCHSPKGDPCDETLNDDGWNEEDLLLIKLNNHGKD